MNKHHLIIIIFFCSIIISCNDWVELPETKSALPEEKSDLFSIGNIYESNLPVNVSCIFTSSKTAGLTVCGTSDGKIYYSTNSGNSWTLKGNVGAKINCFVDYQHDSQKFYIWAGADNGLWESPNSGDSWTHLIGNNEKTGKNTKINNVIVTIRSNQTTASGLRREMTIDCVGSDGEYDLFTTDKDGVDWSRRATFPLSSPYPLEYIYKTILYMASIDIYYCAQDSTIYYFYSSSSMAKAYTLKAKLNEMSSDGNYFSTSKGLYFVSTNGGFRTSNIADQNINSYFISNSGNLFYLINNNILVSPNGQKQYMLSFPNDNIRLEKFINLNGKPAVLCSDGKTYKLELSSSNTNYIEITSPVNGSVVSGDITYSWYGYHFSDGQTFPYRVQVSDSQYFDKILFEKRNYYGYSCQLPQLESGKTYYCRLKVDRDDKLYPWVITNFKVR